MKNWKDHDKANRLTILLLVIYSIALIWILLLKLGVRFSYMDQRQVNLIPFREYFYYGNIDFGGTIMNIVIFVPLGIYAGILFKKWTFGKNLFFFFATSLLIEGLQFILRIGVFDMTDTITNSLGGITGFILFKVIEKVFKSADKSQKLINIIASIGTGIMILFLILLKTGNLWLKYQ